MSLARIPATVCKYYCLFFRTVPRSFSCIFAVRIANLLDDWTVISFNCTSPLQIELFLGVSDSRLFEVKFFALNKKRGSDFSSEMATYRVDMIRTMDVFETRLAGFRESNEQLKEPKNGSFKNEWWLLVWMYNYLGWSGDEELIRSLFADLCRKLLD